MQKKIQHGYIVAGIEQCRPINSGIHPRARVILHAKVVVVVVVDLPY